MSHNAHDHYQALRFRNFRLLLMDDIVRSLGGQIFQVAIGWEIYNHDSIMKMTSGILLTFEVTPRILGLGAAVAAGLGILACLAPAVAVARMSVVQGLKTLD